MPVSKLDTAYRSLVISKFFKKGWGKPENLKKLFEFRKIVSKRETCYQLVDVNYPVTITKEINYSDSILLEGEFISPFEKYLPGLLPEISQPAYFQVLIPKKWQSDHYKPICLHLAGTGDHFFFRRRNLMAKPLVKEAGIGAILLENPFYGFRKPKDQRWSALHNVSDIFVMGGCLILESLVLFHWSKRNGFGPFGLTGISMGGHMASLAATNIPEPIVLVPCLSWTTASGVFTRGVLSSAVDWEFLEQQYFSDGSYSNEIKQMVKVIDNVYVITHGSDNEVSEKIILGGNSASSVSMQSTNKQSSLFEAGQHFAKTYPESLVHVQKLTSSIFSNIGVGNTKIDKSKNEGSDCTENRENCNKQNELKTESKNKNSIVFKNNVEKNRESKLGKVKTKMTDYLMWKNREILNKIVEEKRKEEKKCKLDKEKQEALQFMCGIMDECTHLKNFSTPVDTELIISVTAKADGYVPRDGLTDLQELWRGSEIRYLNTGHISAYLLHQKFFRSAIIDAFEKLKLKYYKKEIQAAHIDKEHSKLNIPRAGFFGCFAIDISTSFFGFCSETDRPDCISSKINTLICNFF